ncbi:hypothetical protein BDV3_006356 [Batrachochytrium dendrobatidis]|nr:hypothetical protein BDEG_25376 [Batrachochytrium dendrobatidis JEL423]
MQRHTTSPKLTPTDIYCESNTTDISPTPAIMTVTATTTAATTSTHTANLTNADIFLPKIHKADKPTSDFMDRAESGCRESAIKNACVSSEISKKRPVSTFHQPRVLSWLRHKTSKIFTSRPSTNIPSSNVLEPYSQPKSEIIHTSLVSTDSQMVCSQPSSTKLEPSSWHSESAIDQALLIPKSTDSSTNANFMSTLADMKSLSENLRSVETLMPPLSPDRFTYMEPMNNTKDEWAAPNFELAADMSVVKPKSNQNIDMVPINHNANLQNESLLHPTIIGTRDTAITKQDTNISQLGRFDYPPNVQHNHQSIQQIDSCQVESPHIPDCDPTPSANSIWALFGPRIWCRQNQLFKSSQMSVAQSQANVALSNSTLSGQDQAVNSSKHISPMFYQRALKKIKSLFRKYKKKWRYNHHTARLLDGSSDAFPNIIVSDTTLSHKSKGLSSKQESQIIPAIQRISSAYLEPSIPKSHNSSNPSRKESSKIDEMDESSNQSQSKSHNSSNHLDHTGHGPMPSASQSIHASSLTRRVSSPEDLHFIRKIASGGFADVFLVRLKSRADDYYALKTMHKANIVEAKLTKQVLYEKNILESVTHPLIVGLLHTFLSPSHLFFLFEYVDGGDLYRIMKRVGKFDGRQARFFVIEITTAVEYLHSHGIVHRDLKPENILLDRTGHIKLADFGFAKLVSTTTSSFCGTPEYMAPEVILQEPYAHLVDWWSLGVILYELVCGYTPFKDKSLNMIYDNVIEGRLQFAREHRGHVRSLVTGLLTIDPAFRLGHENGAQDIMTHLWFVDIHWELVASKYLVPPFTPQVQSPKIIEWQECVNLHDIEEFRSESSYESSIDSDFASF